MHQDNETHHREVHMGRDRDVARIPANIYNRELCHSS